MKAITLMILGLELSNVNNVNNLSFLLSKANQKKSSMQYVEVLARYLNLPQLTGTSIAELTALQDGFSLENDFWLRADPVELKADLAAVYMYGNQHLQLTDVQIQEIKSKIQPLLNDYKIILRTTEQNRWYLQCPERTNITSIAHDEILGKDVINFLPKSSGKINWQKLQTEVQMTLHQLVNNGSVNSLWFWGEGEKLSEVVTVGDYQFFSSEPISGGLARYCKLPIHELPKTLSDNNFWPKLIEGENLIVYDKLASSRSTLDFTNHLQQLDQQFIQPLLAGLKKNQVKQITIDFLNSASYQFKKKNFYYFWKRVRKV